MDSSAKLDILSMNLGELEESFKSFGEPKYRAGQVYQWLHQKGAEGFSDMTNLPLTLRTKLEDIFCIKSLKIVGKLASQRDNTVKYLYELIDGNHVETVLMEYNHGNSICLSTQVGCKMGCRFCASTIAGFCRNLEAGEILNQIYTAERDSGRMVSNIVLMGIGEPLDNFDNVMKFLELISSPKGRNISLRHLSLSTCGLVDGIDKLREKGYGLTLSISLHGVNDSLRSEIMPVNKRYPIKELLAACDRYTQSTGRRISYEYAVIDGVNDSRKDAVDLAALLKGKLAHVNLIPVNSIKERSYKSSRESAMRFAAMLTDFGINATVRRTLGKDIDAACGQLRRTYESKDVAEE